MARKDEPMPLGDLPEYMRSVRDAGQGDYAPVVDIGRIVDDRPRWGRLVAFASAACVLVGLAGIYAFNSTREITIVTSMEMDTVREIVSDEGGRVFSARKDGDGRYKLRVFSLRFGSLMDGLKNNDELERVE